MASDLSPVQRALAAVKEARAKLAAADAAKHEPVAIIGMGCRFPGGANGPEAYWRLLSEGVDAVSEVPPDRFDVEALYDPDPETAGKVTTRWGGFVSGIDQFDAEFFGISPKEAACIDPQHRLVLEVGWEALEDAGQAVDRLAGSKTGVFVGLSTNDYSRMEFASLPDIQPYATSGTIFSVAPGRFSYLFDFRGPSVAVDTACSSSLVALHLACQSLRLGECDLALAGGVNALLAPELTISFSKYKMMAPDGRCKTFDARGDGYVRGEGCGMLVLKRLSDAVAAGDRILALVRGSAVNQDGRSAGLTAPNMHAQQAVIRQALANAQLSPDRIGCIEAHGTGTALGDPIEFEAINAVYGTPDGARCYLGSAKTNIGHLEAAAGVAGVIKAVLSIRHGAVPPLLHFRTLNPHIALEGTRFAIATELTPWPADAPRIAGVSAFAFSGQNAHVILEEPPIGTTAAAAPQAGPRLLPISAHKPEALRALAEAYIARLRTVEDEAALDALCYNASSRRSHLTYRMAIVGTKTEELTGLLEAFLKGQSRPGLLVGQRQETEAMRLAFVFSGQGPQWWAMGRELLADEPLFRREIERYDAMLASMAGWSLLEELGRDEATSRLGETAIAQPALFALQMGLFAVWRAWGVMPDVLIGHSVGEVAAACAAEILTPEEGIQIAYHRGRIMQRASGKGKMASVELPVAEVRKLVEPFGDRIEIGAVNGPSSLTVTGDADAVEALLKDLEAREVMARSLKVDYAFHSHHLVPMQQELRQTLGRLNPRPAVIPVLSTLTGGLARGDDYGDAYWARQMREPVAFLQATEAAIAQGATVFVEIGPHPVLAAALADCLEQAGKPGTVLASLRRKRPERQAMLAALGGLYAAGLSIDWQRLQPVPRPVVSLPPYPWQRQRHWLARTSTSASPSGKSGHPLLQQHLRLAHVPGGHLWEARLDLGELPYLADHGIQGEPVFPAAAYLEMAFQAAIQALGPGVTLEDVLFQRALPLSAEAPPVLQLQLARDDDGGATFAFTRLLAGEGEGLVHARGRASLIAADERTAVVPPALASLRERCQEELAVAPFYQAMRAQGLEYGPAFQGIAGLYRGTGEALGEIAPVARDAHRYGIHPALLDACFQVSMACLGETDGTYLPVGVERSRMASDAGGATRAQGSVWAHAKLREGQPSARPVIDVQVLDGTGLELLAAEGLTLQRLSSVPGVRSEAFHQLIWESAELGALDAPTPGTWLLFADAAGDADCVIDELTAAGQQCVRVSAGTSFAAIPGGFRIDPARPEDYQELLRRAFPAATACRGILHLWGLDDLPLSETSLASLEDATTRGTASVVALVQAILNAGWRDAPRLWVVTRAVQAIALPADRLRPGQAPLWGIGRVLAHEHSDLVPSLIDLGEDPAFELPALVREVLAAGPEDQVLLRGTRRFVARLELAEPPSAVPVVRPDATYLVTGGLGGLGLLSASWLADQGAHHLLLMGRRKPEVDAHTQIEALEARGVEVRVVQADVTDPEQLRTALQPVGMPPLAGIIHAAGVLDDALVLQLDARRLRSVLAPKLRGAWNLHALTTDVSLDFMVFYGSAAAVIGNPGQGNYAAANAFLDLLAEHRRAQGLPALSIAWGPWSDLGLAAARSDRGHRLSAQGLASIAPEEGLAMLGQLLGDQRPRVGAFRLNLRQWRQSYPRVADSPLFERLAARLGASSERHSGAIRSLLEAAEPGRRTALLQEQIREQAAQVLGVAAARVEVARPLETQGFDSLMGVDLKNRLENGLGLALPATLVFAYPTVEALTRRLLELSGLMGVPPATPEPSVGENGGQNGGEPGKRKLEAIQQLSEDELTRLLREKLAATKRYRS